MEKNELILSYLFIPNCRGEGEVKLQIFGKKSSTSFNYKKDDLKATPHFSKSL